MYKVYIYMYMYTGVSEPTGQQLGTSVSHVHVHCTCTVLSNLTLYLASLKKEWVKAFTWNDNICTCTNATIWLSATPGSQKAYA